MVYKMYKVKYTDKFEKKLRKLDISIQKLILRWIKKHLVDCDEPKSFGKGLTQNLKGYWRYRIGDYRLLVEIKDKKLNIIAIDIDHRSRVYKR